MANDRITQEVVEVLIVPSPPGRTTQEAVEVLILPNPKGRTTQQVVEVLLNPLSVPFGDTVGVQDNITLELITAFRPQVMIF